MALAQMIKEGENCVKEYLDQKSSPFINGSMKGIPSLSPLPQWGRGKGGGNLISFPLPLLCENFLANGTAPAEVRLITELLGHIQDGLPPGKKALRPFHRPGNLSFAAP
jgi:hypothetical protein